MNPPNLVASVLRKSLAFAELSPDTLEQVALCMPQRTLAQGEVIVEEGDPGDELFLVLSGALLLNQRYTNAEMEVATRQIGSIGPGEVIGELSLLTGHARTSTVQASEPTQIAALSRSDFDHLCARFPQEMAPIAAWMAARVDAHQIATAFAESHLLGDLPTDIRRDLAASCQRIDLPAGEVLFHIGQAGDALYFILSGRVRLQRSADSEYIRDLGRDLQRPGTVLTTDPPPLAELGKGDLLGELAMLTGEPRSATAVALRDSHLARLDRAAFERLVTLYPGEILGLFSRHLALRLQTQHLQSPAASQKSQTRPPVAIAVLPLSAAEQSGSARDFTSELVRQLSLFGPTMHLNRAVIDRIFPPRASAGTAGRAASSSLVDAVAERRLLAWLDELERIYRHVVYEADYQSGVQESAWTARCLRQADVLLVVAGGADGPEQSEQTMLRLTGKALPTVKTTLVMVHKEGPGSVTLTAGWKRVLGFSAHEHVRRLASGKYHSGDVGRIARALNGRSVGLVLGGGFAFGLAHIGVVDAMRDLDIPIDFVGGTSMGAIIAAACAQEFTHSQMLEVMDKGCAQALKGDYTLPIVSLLTGRKVTAALGQYLEGLEIEDLWLPYFAISASLVHARMVVHRNGSALRSVLASCRAPGMFPPLGWNDDVLVDGGLVNNIPADVMRTMIGTGTVFAADVSPTTEFTAGEEYGMDVSGWKVAWRNFNPFRRAPKMGTIGDVLMRLIRLGGVGHEQQIRASTDLYLSVPLDQFSVRDFHQGEAMSKAGYNYTMQQLQVWIDQHGRPWLGSTSG